jgi:hypothetical protein
VPEEARPTTLTSKETLHRKCDAEALPAEMSIAALGVKCTSFGVVLPALSLDQLTPQSVVIVPSP